MPIRKRVLRGKEGIFFSPPMITGGTNRHAHGTARQRVSVVCHSPMLPATFDNPKFYGLIQIDGSSEIVKKRKGLVGFKLDEAR